MSGTVTGTVGENYVMERFFHYIQELQKKPHHVRRRIAAAVAGVITVGIVTVWLTSVGQNGFIARIDSQEASGETSVTDMNSPLGTVADSVANVKRSFSDRIAEFSSLFSMTTSTATPSSFTSTTAPPVRGGIIVRDVEVSTGTSGHRSTTTDASSVATTTQTTQ